MAELEHWRDIKGYVGLYEISDKGRVASLSRKYAHKETIILVPNISDRGYALVTLCKNGKTKHFQVHRLVAEAFIDNPKNKPQVNHIDGDPLNNKVENLEWVSHRENMLHSHRVLHQGTVRGKVMNNKPVKCLDTGEIFFSASEAARQKGCSQSNITKAILGERNKAGGLRWAYDFGGEE